MEGSCPIDGGRLRYYDKLVQWMDDRDLRKCAVTQRQMAAKCVKNDENWRPDKTDRGE